MNKKTGNFFRRIMRVILLIALIIVMAGSISVNVVYARTVISNLIMMASHVTTHARQLVMGLGKSNVWRHLFADYCESSVAV